MEKAPPGRMKKEQTLTQDGFDRLLASLDADREQAAARYEELRRAVIAFFSFRHSPDPLAQTDETLNRVARRLSEGQEITAANPASYFYAVARNVWREHLAKPYSTVELSANFPEQVVLPGQMLEAVSAPDKLLEEQQAQAAQEARLHRLAQCLDKLMAADRTLLMAYYKDYGANKIARREALAQEYGLTIPSLRNRTCRLRDKLAACLQNQ